MVIAMVEQFNIGQIVNVVGIKGELRVYPLTDYKERFEEIDSVLIQDQYYTIENVRYHKELVVLKLKGIDDRNTAEKYKTQYLKIDRKDARVLPEDTYYIADLVGCEIYSIEGEYIGILKDVVQNSAQDLYEVETKNSSKRILIPAVDEFIKEVDIENRIIKVQLIEGMMDV